MIQDRDSGRTFFLEVWGKHKNKLPLEALEQMVLDVILQHPEYHVILEKDEKEISTMEFTPEMGMTNPFLHMGMHIAILEQIGANRPPGITALYQQLLPKYPSAHDLEHSMMECLGESLWLAQRNNTLPDEAQYLEQVKRLK
ncbi:MAG: DUF1841 domain-containing protein [Gammaproteobacteria bacterium]|nr:MAG: DUF1841 domain-containing protein [Gammaproteobacteria bacterium]RKZ70531.1 MAG: DUF1841 domain-containing protein [Gammaproteobacteria bacterium]